MAQQEDSSSRSQPCADAQERSPETSSDNEGFEHYAALGMACEANGLAGFSAAGEMWFQPPRELIEEHVTAELRRKAVQWIADNHQPEACWASDISSSHPVLLVSDVFDQDAMLVAGVAINQRRAAP